MVLGEMLMGMDLEGEELGEASKCMVEGEEGEVRLEVEVEVMLMVVMVAYGVGRTCVDIIHSRSA
jgi:hypothetical protein